MTESARVLSRLQVAMNYADDKSAEWALWKTTLVLNEIERLTRLMEVKDRRQVKEAGRVG